MNRNELIEKQIQQLEEYREEENPLEKYSTTQLKKELRRRKKIY